jgi:di/tricarboxylate transporter
MKWFVDHCDLSIPSNIHIPHSLTSHPPPSSERKKDTLLIVYAVVAMCSTSLIVWSVQKMQKSEEVLSNYLKFKSAQKQKRLSLIWVTGSFIVLLLIHFLVPFLEPFSASNSSLGKILLLDG